MAYRMEDFNFDFSAYKRFTEAMFEFDEKLQGASETFGHFTRDPYSHINVELPDEYLDAGIVLTKGFTISRDEFEEMSLDEWKQIKTWADSMPNIVVEEMEYGSMNHMLWIYDAVPCITTVPA